MECVWTAGQCNYCGTGGERGDRHGGYYPCASKSNAPHHCVHGSGGGHERGDSLSTHTHTYTHIHTHIHPNTHARTQTHTTVWTQFAMYTSLTDPLTPRMVSPLGGSMGPSEMYT